jgi:2-methylcitrate dehydratase
VGTLGIALFSRKIFVNTYCTLECRSNQARGIGEYARNFIWENRAQPSAAVLERVELFHLDAVACGVAALAEGMNAPRILHEEALRYCDAQGATLLGSTTRVSPEKAVLANCAAVRELDANGTNFGYNPRTGYIRGEFGHNDFYAVPMAAAQVAKLNGSTTLLGMLCLDEIRGRLAECFALKDHKIDHVLHGAIASAAVYGAMLGASVEQIESAIGLLVAHYVPFRAIRHGHQLSDSKGASAALSTEMAIVSMQRAMRGFIGPADIFRNPQAIFSLFEPPAEKDVSPFDLTLATGGDDFAVMGMHFKLGLYEHQSAGAIEGLLQLLQQHPQLLQSPEHVQKIRITIYEPAFSIIGDPHKRDPHTRQSADHSMVYIVATLLRKAFELQRATWSELILMPQDYNATALFHPLTRAFMERIDFQHGGAEYDVKYPDGIPTSVEIHHATLGNFSSGLIMYPAGHARNTSGNLHSLLMHKVNALASLGVDNVAEWLPRFTRLSQKSAAEMVSLYAFELRDPT